MEFTLRRIDAGDAILRAAIVSLMREIEAHSEWRFGVDPESCEWWIAFTKKGKEAAFAALSHAPTIERAGYLCAAGVLPPFRGHGLQRRLIRARIERARERGYIQVVSETWHDNVASANSLIACGFRRFAPKKNWGDPKYVHYWQRHL